MALPIDFTFNISPEWLIEKMPTNQVTDKFLSYKSAQWAPDSVCLICQRRFATSIYHDAPHFSRQCMLHLSWHSEPTTLQQLWALWSSTLRFPQPHDCFRVGFICLSFTHHCLQLPFLFVQLSNIRLSYKAYKLYSFMKNNYIHSAKNMHL